MKQLILFLSVFAVLACSSSSQRDNPAKGQTQKKGNPFHKFESQPKLPDLNKLPTRIAFGSCGHQDKPMPILHKVIEQSPDLFIYLGDNIYGDSRKVEVLKKKYSKLAAKSEFQALKASCPLLAVWDDHDFGENDAGRHYPLKTESKEIFLEFWQEPQNSERRNHPGIYHSMVFQENNKRLQIILLDTRTFRDNLIKNNGVPPHKNDYMPNPSPDSTMLGQTQWDWLETQFRKPADIRLIASSTQFAHSYNGWESWSNVPHERQRMLELIKSTKANGVIFISGDVHWGEISKLQTEEGYLIYDVTSSGITQTWPNTEPNENRIGEVVRENHFGLIEFDWEAEPINVTAEIINIEGLSRVSHTFSANELGLD